MSLPRVRSLAVGIPELVNSVAQACLEIFSLLQPCHPLGLSLPCRVGLSSGPQDGVTCRRPYASFGERESFTEGQASPSGHIGQNGITHHH